MDKDYLTLKRASASRPSGHWYDNDYDVLCEGAVVGRVMKAAASPVGGPWLWTLAYGHHEDRTPIYGYEPTREAAMEGNSQRAGELHRRTAAEQFATILLPNSVAQGGTGRTSPSR